MKITAEFESIEEIIEFTNRFGKNVEKSKKEVKESKKEEPSTEEKTVKEEKPSTEEKTVKEEKHSIEATKDEPKITKEMVREVCARAMKAGKQAEVKKIISDHGASKLPELKEEEYAAVVAEVEAL